MSFFYADIKTDELKVHGHANSIPGQIEILDAASSNMVIIKAPNVLPSNVTLILPTANGSTNSILTSTDTNGTLAFVTTGGDLELGSGGQFTVNGISNTSTIQSSANIVLTGSRSLYFTDSNTGINSPANGNLDIRSTSGNVNITANHDIILTTNSASTIRLVGPTAGSLATFGEDANGNTLITLGSTDNTFNYDGNDFTIGQNHSSNLVLKTSALDIQTITLDSNIDPQYTGYISNLSIGGNIISFTSNTNTINTYAYKRTSGTLWTTSTPVSAVSNITLTFDQYLYSNSANSTISLGARKIKYNQVEYSSLDIFRDGFITFGSGDVWNRNRINFFNLSYLQSAYPTSNTYYGFASIDGANDALTITFQDVAYPVYVGYDPITYSSIYSNTGNIYTQVVLYLDNNQKYGSYDIHYGTMNGNASLSPYTGYWLGGLKSLNNYTTTTVDVSTMPSEYTTATSNSYSDYYNLVGTTNPAIPYSNSSPQSSIIYTFTSNVGELNKFAFKRASGTNWTTTAPYTPTSETFIYSLSPPVNIDLGASGRTISFNQSARSNLWISQSGYVTFDSQYSSSNIISFFNGLYQQISGGATMSYGYTTFSNSNDALLITLKGMQYGYGPYFGSLYLQMVLYCDNSPLSGTYELNYGTLSTDTANSYNYTVGCSSNYSTTSVSANSVGTNYTKYPYYNTVFKKGDNEINLVMDVEQNMNYINLTSSKGPTGAGFRSNGTVLQYCSNNGGTWYNFGGVGGSNGQVQFNDSNVIGGDSGFTYNKVNKAVYMQGDLLVSNITTGYYSATTTGNLVVYNNAVIYSNAIVYSNSYAQNSFIVGNQYSSNPPTLNSSGLSNIPNIGTAALTITGSGNLSLRDSNTVINSGETGNLDIRATAGNVNITANHDVVITTNSASTIRFVGPDGSSPMNLSFLGACSYINFGSVTGESGPGIRYDGANVAVGSSGTWSNISNTSLSIAGRTVALGGSNTVGFSDLTGNIGASQIDPNSITNEQLAGSISNDKLANTNILVAGKTLTLGSPDTQLALNDMSDVNLGSLSNLDLLQYDSISSKWINKSDLELTGNLDITGITTLSNISVGNLSVSGISELTTLEVSGNSTLGNISSGNIDITGSLTFDDTNSISIGLLSGETNQGSNAIAIGYAAGQTNQHSNTIVLNTTDQALNTDGSGRLFIAPIRNVTGFDTGNKPIKYNQSTLEVVYEDNTDVLLLGSNSTGSSIPVSVTDTGILKVFNAATTPSLSNLSDIQFTGLSNNQVISYNSDTSKWLNTSNLELTKLTTQEIHATNGGNLDIQSTVGNINITANHDIVLTTNSASTIRLIGQSSSHIVNFSYVSGTGGGSKYVSFGGTTGESGYGIKADNLGVIYIKKDGAGNWSELSNTSISIGGRSVALGGSNTIGFTNLTGVIDESQISTGTISNDLLAGGISNDKLANNTITLGGREVALGGSNTIALSNLSDISLGALSNNDILLYNGSNWVNNQSPITLFPSSVNFITSTQHLSISNARMIMIQLVAGGGGGGGQGPGGSTDHGGGGGGGEYVELYLNTSHIGSNTHIYISIGSAGTAGSGSSNGGTGGNTTIRFSDGSITNGTIICNALGGNGGTQGDAFGVGGLGGNGGTISIGSGFLLPGSAGEMGYDAGTTILNPMGGNGGNSKLGVGGRGETDGSSSSGTVGIYGGGGGGGCLGDNFSRPGTSGGTGLAIVKIYY